MQKEAVSKEMPDNTVFWSVIGVACIFVVVLAAAMIVRTDITGKIVQQWFEPSMPFESNPYACLDVPMCGGSQSFMCCAVEPLPNGMKCTQALIGYKSEAPVCPDAMPYKCACPEKYPYRQSWPVPFR